MVSAMGKKSRRKCFVVSCGSNADDTPDKIFLCVPRNPEIRKRWFDAVGLPNASANRCLYCCEDHFDLETDCRNWLFYKLMGSRMRLKKDVVPHKFDCQSNTKGTNYSQLPTSDRRLKVEMMKKIKDEIYSEKMESKSSAKKTDKASLVPRAGDIVPSLLSGAMGGTKIGIKEFARSMSASEESNSVSTLPELFLEVNDENVTVTGRTAIELELNFENDEKQRVTTSRVVLQRGILPHRLEPQINKPHSIHLSSPDPDALQMGNKNRETKTIGKGFLCVKEEDITDQFERQIGGPHMQSPSMHPDNVEMDFEFSDPNMLSGGLIVKEEDISDEFECQFEKNHNLSSTNNISDKNEPKPNITNPESPVTEELSSKMKIKVEVGYDKSETEYDFLVVKQENISSQFEHEFDETCMQSPSVQLDSVFSNGSVDLGKLSRYDPDAGNDENEKSSETQPGMNSRLGYGHSEAESIGIDPEDLEEHMLNQSKHSESPKNSDVHGHHTRAPDDIHYNYVEQNWSFKDLKLQDYAFITGYHLSQENVQVIQNRSRNSKSKEPPNNGGHWDTKCTKPPAPWK